MSSDPSLTSLLADPDNTPAPRVSRGFVRWSTRLAKLPFVHSVFWTTFFACAPFTPEWRLFGGATWLRELSLHLITIWLVYGMIKFAVTGVACFVGITRCKRDCEVRDWEDRVPADAAMRFRDVIHIVVIPNYKEPEETLSRTLDTLSAQANSSNIVVVLAMEARDASAPDVAGNLIERHGSSFLSMKYTMHRMVAGEVAGKSSNENWAMRCATHHLVDELGMRDDHIVLTTCDADTYFHPQHFSALSHAFCCDPKRYNRFWQGCTCFYPNIRQAPLLARVRYTLLSVCFLGQQCSPMSYALPFSVYSLSLRLAVRASFWDPSVIPEDWHMYLRCFYATEGDVKVMPLYLPVGCECVVDKTPWSSLAACYEQSKRWQWGAIDVGFIVLSNMKRKSASLPLRRKLMVLFAAYEQHMMFNVMWVALLLAPFSFHHLGSWRFFVWVAFLATNWTFLTVLDSQYRRRLLRGRQHFDHPTETYSAKQCAVLALSPVSDFLLFVLPTFHAHLRMALSTDFAYIVAPKAAANGQPPLERSSITSEAASTSTSATTIPCCPTSCPPLLRTRGGAGEKRHLLTVPNVSASEFEVASVRATYTPIEIQPEDAAAIKYGTSSSSSSSSSSSLPAQLLRVQASIA
jgi:hypothetical protein